MGAVMALLVGCGNSQKQAEEESTLKRLSILYGQYIGQHMGQPPADEAAFRTFVDGQSEQAKASWKLKDPADLWKSSRDQQPYVVIYGPATGPAGPAGQPVIAYESKGVGGKRHVASSLGAVEEVTEARFQELVPMATSAP